MKRNNTFLKYVLLVALSLIIAAIICEYKGDAWEETVRNGLYKLTNDSVPDFAAESIDAKGIPYVYYPLQNGIVAGNQYNATIVCNYALYYYNTFLQTKDAVTKKKFLNCIEWLAGNITVKDGYGSYLFKWQQPWYPSVKAPYTSGMTSGRAIEVFTDAYRITGDSTYLNRAKLLVKGFYRPIQSGGFTYKEATGWWYEEIADKELQTPRILDGHIFALLGVHEYFTQTKDDSADYVFQIGMRSLRNNLSKYDVGNGAMYYDALHKVADKKYHRILTRQMKQLHEITKDSFFLQYYKKWNAPLEIPYLQRVFKERNRSGIILYLLVSVGIGLFLTAIVRGVRRMKLK